MDHRHPHLEANQNLIIDILQGEEQEQLGAEPIRTGGLVKATADNGRDIKAIKDQLSNGRGISVNLPAWSKWAAFILILVNIAIGVKTIIG